MKMLPGQGIALCSISAMLLFHFVLFETPSLVEAHDEVIDKRFNIDGPLATLGASLVLPPHTDLALQKVPCVVLAGGTMSHNRDGALFHPRAPRRDALKRIATRLALAGFATVRFDKVGYGESQSKQGWSGSYADEAQALGYVMKCVREQNEFSHVVVAGESAGAYLACIAAKEGIEADAYIFLGAHCGPAQEIYETNFARLVSLTQASEQWRALAERDFRLELALGRHYRAMFDAARSGVADFDLVDGDFQKTIGLARRREELVMPPDELFRFIRKPTLALAGEFDLNVSPTHAAKIVQKLRASGNHSCTCQLIKGADHSFQLAPADAELRLRERYTFESFQRPYADELYLAMTQWLGSILKDKTPNTSTLSSADELTHPERAAESIERDLRTDVSPARTFLAPGIQIVEDITNLRQRAGVFTLEGEIGPLLLGSTSQAHYLDMPAGMYCVEHPHSSESLIYTVRGRWILCSHGRRQVMQPGSLFHFAPNTPTGYEVPFKEPAMILVFKAKRTSQDDAEFINYLRNLRDRLKSENEAGVPYFLRELPEEHPANQFAKSINPSFFAQTVKPTDATQDTANLESRHWKFDNLATGDLPQNWTVTRSLQEPGSEWLVITDPDKATNRVVRQSSSAGAKRQFNLCISDVSFQDLDVSVRLRAKDGEIDRGGGLVWRYQDAKNYYIARWNPLENNLRTYKVVDGARTQLDTAPAPGDGQTWHTLRIVNVGRDIRGYFDGKLLVEAEDDQFTGHGRIGLWSKADAVTDFDELHARRATPADIAEIE